MPLRLPLVGGQYEGTAIPEPLTFAMGVSFPIGDLTEQETEAKFPGAYYERHHDRAGCRAGRTLRTSSRSNARAFSMRGVVSNDRDSRSIQC